MPATTRGSLTKEGQIAHALPSPNALPSTSVWLALSSPPSTDLVKSLRSMVSMHSHIRKIARTVRDKLVFASPPPPTIRVLYTSPSALMPSILEISLCKVTVPTSGRRRSRRERRCARDSSPHTFDAHKCHSPVPVSPLQAPTGGAATVSTAPFYKVSTALPVSDESTTISTATLDAWLTDTSAITKALLQGDGEGTRRKGGQHMG